MTKQSSLAGTVWLPSALRTYEGPLLLDTHIWVWYLEGDHTNLSVELVALLDRSASTNNLYVSDISYWEVAVKASKGKLMFSLDVTVWLRRAEKAPGIRFLPLDRDILLLSTRLPGTVHNDSADRMLIAVAQLHNLPIVTADRLIVDYAMTHPGTPVVNTRG